MFSIEKFLRYNGLSFEVLRSNDWETVIEVSNHRIVTAVQISNRTIGDCLVSKNWIDGRYVHDSELVDTLIERLNLNV